MSLLKAVANYLERRNIKAKIKSAHRYVLFISGDQTLKDDVKAQFILNALKHIRELETEFKTLR